MPHDSRCHESDNTKKVFHLWTSRHSACYSVDTVENKGENYTFQRSPIIFRLYRRLSADQDMTEQRQGYPSAGYDSVVGLELNIPLNTSLCTGR